MIFQKRNSPFLILVFFLESCSAGGGEWYRRLPGEKKEERNLKMAGLWKKKTHPRSPMKSKYFTSEWDEEILISSDGTFVKKFKERKRKGEETVEELIIGRGTWTAEGNWVLLSTSNIEKKMMKNNENAEVKSFDTAHQLLYYSVIDRNMIVPMVNDRAYTEREFGVKDGAERPYDENGRGFRTFLKNYSEKEYHSHSYYRAD
ncbi:MAG TPA: hypothetical protein PKK05_20095 [Leptospiraceae bacterium]|nr:hypothetical protein [Leptospiraceae bacterium]